VGSFSTSYRDNVTLLEGAENDGTYTDGTPFFSYGIHPQVLYGAGFLPGYSTGDIDVMIANGHLNLGGGGVVGAGDCNDNCIPDDCDIADCDGSAWCQDCQGDIVPDGCQLEGNDCQPDLIPDDCQLEDNDCQSNGIPDECDIRDCGEDAGAREPCVDPDAVITIELLTDSWGSETSWELTEQGVGVVAAGSGYASSSFYTIDVDVCSASCYDFTIFDEWGDGIYSPGGFTIYYEGEVVADYMGGGFTGDTMTVSDIGGCGVPESCGPFAWCQDCQPDGIPDGCQLDVLPAPDPCIDPDAVITIDLLTDSWGYETSWTLTEVGIGEAASGSGYASSTAYSIDVDVCSTSCYEFTIDDEYGDGIYSPGGFTIYYEGAVVFDAMGGGFTGSTMTIPGIGAGCTSRDAAPLISQPPNQSNGIFADCDCDFCGTPPTAQVLAENFVMTETADITTVRFWGGSYAGDHEPANSWNIGFYENAAGLPGAEIASYLDVAGTQVQTGITLFGVHEWDVTVTLSPAITLDAGTYFVAAYANSVGDTDSWFWEAGNFDAVAGVMGQAYGFTCPPTFPYYDAATDMAFELYVQTGPPANDCNENCIPDECDPDCNCDGTPDDCEDPPFIPSDPTIECPEDVIVTCPESTDPADTGMATGLDNCGNPSLITYSDEVTPGDPIGLVMYTITRTWVSTDECAELSVECVQTITVNKQTPSLIIKQGACPAPLNRSSHGVIPMVLTGDVDFDVTEVVQATVVLRRADGEGGVVAPSPGSPPGFQFKDINHPWTGEGACSCNEDQDSDGIMDLAMKFRTDDVVDELGLWDQPPGAIVLFLLTGELADGCEFIAIDCMRIVPGGGPGAVLSVSAATPGLWVVVDPVDLTLDGEGYVDFVRTYEAGTIVTLTVPVGEFGERFVGWRIDGTMQRSTFRTLEVTVDDSTTVEVVYSGGPQESLPADPSVSPVTPASSDLVPAGSDLSHDRIEYDPG
jgi:hypothetical protein